MRIVDSTSRRVRVVSAALATLVLGAALVPVLAGPAQACSCVGMTDAQAYEQADAVFAGRVESVTEPAGLFGVVSSGDPVTATLVVDTVYKGSVYERMPVTTAYSSASCGADFVQGVEYAVFGTYGSSGSHAADDVLRAALCDGTRAIDQTPLVLAASGTAPMAGGMVEPSGFPLLGWLSFGAVALLGLLPIALWVRFSRGTRS
jgi:hypothetical protein